MDFPANPFYKSESATGTVAGLPRARQTQEAAQAAARPQGKGFN